MPDTLISPTVIARDLAERRTTALLLTGVLVVLAVAGLGATSGLEDTIGSLTESFPEALLAFIPADVPGGYVVGEIVNLIAPLALVGYAVVTGGSATAGEETTGTMSVLAAQPVSRAAVLAAKTAGLLVTLLGVVVAFCAALLAGAALFDVGLEPGNVVAMGAHLFALAAFFGALALAVGAAAGSPGVATAAAGTAAAVAYLANAMLPLADLDGLAELSPWHYYAGDTPITNGINPGIAVLLGLAIVALAAAFTAFTRRDLKG